MERSVPGTAGRYLYKEKEERKQGRFYVFKKSTFFKTARLSIHAGYSRLFFVLYYKKQIEYLAYFTKNKKEDICVAHKKKMGYNQILPT